MRWRRDRVDRGPPAPGVERRPPPVWGSGDDLTIVQALHHRGDGALAHTTSPQARVWPPRALWRAVMAFTALRAPTWRACGLRVSDD